MEKLSCHFKERNQPHELFRKRYLADNALLFAGIIAHAAEHPNTQIEVSPSRENRFIRARAHEIFSEEGQNTVVELELANRGPSFNGPPSRALISELGNLSGDSLLNASMIRDSAYPTALYQIANNKDLAIAPAAEAFGALVQEKTGQSVDMQKLIKDQRAAIAERTQELEADIAKQSFGIAVA